MSQLTFATLYTVSSCVHYMFVLRPPAYIRVLFTYYNQGLFLKGLHSFHQFINQEMNSALLPGQFWNRSIDNMILFKLLTFLLAKIQCTVNTFHFVT